MYVEAFCTKKVPEKKSGKIEGRYTINAVFGIVGCGKG